MHPNLPNGSRPKCTGSAGKSTALSKGLHMPFLRRVPQRGFAAPFAWSPHRIVRCSLTTLPIETIGSRMSASDCRNLCCNPKPSAADGGRKSRLDGPAPAEIFLASSDRRRRCGHNETTVTIRKGHTAAAACPSEPSHSDWLGIGVHQGPGARERVALGTTA